MPQPTQPQPQPPDDIYGLESAPPKRGPAPPTQPQPFRDESTGDTMLDDEINRRRSMSANRREEQAEIEKTYLVPLIMFLGGAGIVCCLLMLSGPAAVVTYIATYALSVPLGVAVYFLFCWLWIGFDAPLHLIALRLAAVFAVTDAVQILLALIPGIGPLVSLGGWLLIYFALLMYMLEVELVEAFIIGVITFFLRLGLLLSVAAVA